MDRAPIRFLLGNERREIAEIDPTMTVLNYLRLTEHLRGTKEGCAEGDCGACTVVLAEPDGGKLRYRAVNSCIQFVPTLDGKQLITVEHLKDRAGGLHPCQQAMVDCHGSQCGFCTPGFVMSLFAMFHGAASADRAGIEDALAGNLCRCTGYGPIIDAAARVRDLAARDQFDASEQATLEILRGLQRRAGSSLAGDGRQYFAPRTIRELAILLEENPAATLLAGGTDVGLWVTKQHRRLAPIIYLGDIFELKQVCEADGMIEVGAAVPYADLHDRLGRHWPDFGELIRRLGSVQVRNAGTMGGNIANGSPIGDGPPALIALGASLIMRKGAVRRELPLEAYFLDYGKQDRKPGEFVELIRIPSPDPAWQFRCYKVSKRFDQDITACLGAFNARLEGGKCQDIRICFGGMAATPKRAAKAEAVLKGNSWSRATVEQACVALSADYRPIDDMRASAAYRLRVAQNLLRKFFVETTGPEVETRVIHAGKQAPMEQVSG